MSIQVKNLVKIYGDQKAVDDISFSIGKGEIVGFLGPNGAGKSTTMKILTGYLEADGGEALVDGQAVSKDPLRAKRKIGYLPESNALYPDMYIREYLEFIASVHVVEPVKKRIEEVISLTGLTLEARKKIGQLSKGYKQRVGLAAALLHDPEILILDEPTSGLDPNQIVEIREVIREQGREKTVLFSSHILQEVEALCDRVIIINRGKLVADDPIKELQLNLMDKHIVRVQFKETVDKSELANIQAEIIEQPTAYDFRITTTKPEQVRKQLMELALKNHLNIISLQSENQRLEEVFRKLTGNEG